MMLIAEMMTVMVVVMMIMVYIMKTYIVTSEISLFKFCFFPLPPSYKVVLITYD